MKEKDHEVVFSVPYINVFKGIKPIITPKSGEKNEQRKWIGIIMNNEFLNIQTR